MADDKKVSNPLLLLIADEIKLEIVPIIFDGKKD